MELYAAVRRSVYVEGGSERAAARRFGLARETVRKMLRYRLPPGYRRQQPIRCPKLEAFTGGIDQILRDDQHRPKKQRHTAKRICERLRAEHDFTGGYTIVKAYVREQKLGGQEMFVPLAHPFVPLCPALSRIPRLLVVVIPETAGGILWTHNSSEPPWYGTCMPGGVTGNAREGLPMSINFCSRVLRFERRWGRVVCCVRGIGHSFIVMSEEHPKAGMRRQVLS